MNSIRNFRGRAPWLGLALVLFLCAVATPSRPAWAGKSEDRLLSITKTTVYGALLGGLLGVAGALVVKEGNREGAIRWGITLGAFAGCVYGIVDTSGDDSDELSLRPPEPAPPVGLDLVQGWRLGGPVAAPDRGWFRLTGDGDRPRSAEVLHDGLEEEDHGGQEGRHPSQSWRREGDL